MKLLICSCPEVRFDLQEVARQLADAGWQAHLTPPMCTPPGLREASTLAQKPGEWLLAACSSAHHAGLFMHLWKEPQVIDLLGCAGPEEAVGAILLALEAPERPPKATLPLHQSVLVIGGGVGGCQAALDLANAGYKVYLADSSLSIGGTMAQLDKTFPTLDCSICILGPKLVEVSTHSNIELLTYARIEKISGQAGSFSVDLTLKPRYVDMSKCVGCGSCAEVCPVIVPSRWNLGLKPRKCIRIIFEQSVPLRATIEKEYCIDCRLCAEACDHQAIDLEDAPRFLQLEVGAIVLATGARPFDPSIKSEYGYGRIPAVITNLEYERIICATGPTQGALITCRGRAVKSLAFIQCVGSRDRRFLPYCSGYCCTASIKEAMIALEHHPEAEVSIFYNDIRTSGKGFEELYRRAQKAGIRFIKGLPGLIREDGAGRAVVCYEDLISRVRQELTVDLAVLAVGLKAPSEALPFQDFSLERDFCGFYQSRHPILHPLESTTPGVFLAGTSQGPKDISETVCQASGAAARVMAMFAALRQAH
ncbi:MAG: CoB--CoM heterodisulfide reductase iron-sulfur subunit A family protein [Deltaproteobacteria bacterium]|nr:CoB--CoM heterodisulfide reductase iron-sulfur subunit A family protein [Deltaproteobacteria bacterium]MBI4795427.1 CoB--CoM heterodisulfide reductase iron-sulfur subunit A family protein [Deltaproteobacteria bacterium]